MREIKFRVWDKVDYMSTPFTLQDLQLKKIEFTSDCPVMQYIGLKDKNGKEIYEGDIVRIPLYGESVIVWNEKICSFQYAYHAIGKGTSVGGRMTNTLYDHDTKVKFEVIGNIYENPELLEAEKQKL